MNSTAVIIRQFNISNVPTGNITTEKSFEPGANWTFMSFFWLLIIVSSSFTNTLLLYLFLTQRHLMKAPFNTYLFNLLACNLLYAVIQNPQDLAGQLYPKYPHNALHCSFYLYLTRIFEAAMRNNHCLITFNRLWAVLAPMSYRLNHSRKIAYFAIAASYIVVHVLMLPVVAIDSAYFYRRLTVWSCGGSYGNQPLRYKMLQSFFYDIQLTVVLGGYLIICWKRYLRERQRAGVGTVLPTGTAATTLTVASDPRGAELTHLSAPVPTGGAAHSGTGTAKPRLGGRATGRSSSSKAFLVLTFLTLSVAVCWTPMLSTFTINVVPGGSSAYLLVSVGIVLFSVQSTLDPLLFVVALPDLREAVRLWFIGKVPKW